MPVAYAEQHVAAIRNAFDVNGQVIADEQHAVRVDGLRRLRRDLAKAVLGDQPVEFGVADVFEFV